MVVFWSQQDDFARHQVADAAFGELAAFLGHAADNIAFGNHADQSVLGPQTGSAPILCALNRLATDSMVSSAAQVVSFCCSGLQKTDDFHDDTPPVITSRVRLGIFFC